MRVVTQESSSLRQLLRARRDVVSDVLARYHAENPRLFGSVARGDARPGSDVDLMIDLRPGGGNPLLRVAGMSEELSNALGVRVDVVAPELLRTGVSATAMKDVVPL